MADPQNWKKLAGVQPAPVICPDYKESHEKMCKTYEPQPRELIPDDPETGYKNYYDDTITTHFNYELEYNGVPSKMIYGLFGDIYAPDYRQMATRDCEAVDCLNPCYDDGSCSKCKDAFMSTYDENTGDGTRLDICDQCTVPTRSRGRGRR